MSYLSMRKTRQLKANLQKERNKDLIDRIHQGKGIHWTDYYIEQRDKRLNDLTNRKKVD